MGEARINCPRAVLGRSGSARFRIQCRAIGVNEFPGLAPGSDVPDGMPEVAGTGQPFDKPAQFAAHHKTGAFFPQIRYGSVHVSVDQPDPVTGGYFPGGPAGEQVDNLGKNKRVAKCCPSHHDRIAMGLRQRNPNGILPNTLKLLIRRRMADACSFIIVDKHDFVFVNYTIRN